MANENRYTIIEMNEQFLVDQQDNLMHNRAAGVQIERVNPKSWVIQDHKGWRGWNPHTGTYFDEKIE